jgi:hypothetical protein
MLVALRDELYGGSWDRMERDLRDRLEGNPYVFKLADRIEEDIERIEKLRRYEKEHGFVLSAPRSPASSTTGGRKNRRC